ncbi:MAG: recombinase family protein [Acetatifactor sp.]|nr:recombinase family protein [Acetatifactor sp.]
MKKVRKIEVVKNSIEKCRRKVAAYCRVSTKYESQKSSIDLQISYYTRLINENPEWDNAGIYIDYGSRCRIKGREGFCKMIQKALEGEIDYIITKSISRFSGNTVDMLQTIRKLKENGVVVYFEKEELDSTDERAEQMITIYTALAQEEIRNMSENIKWGYEQKFAKGELLNNYKLFYGYYVQDGELKINDEQAKVVRNIFQWYIEGFSFRQIKLELERQGILTASGGKVWHEKVIQGMLRNEKYCGDTMLQKTITEDFLTGKRVKNDGQKARYYVYNSHKGIVSKEVYMKAVCEMNSRRRVVKYDDGTVESRKKYNGQNLLGNLLVCGECGASFRRRTERGKVVYRCATRIEKGRESCKESPTIEEEWMKGELGRRVCDGEYDEKLVRARVEEVIILKGKGLNLILK